LKLLRWVPGDIFVIHTVEIHYDSFEKISGCQWHLQSIDSNPNIYTGSFFVLNVVDIDYLIEKTLIRTIWTPETFIISEISGQWDTTVLIQEERQT
jgi:hypothetical protein